MTWQDARETADDRHHRLTLIRGLTYEVVPMKSVDAAIAALPPGSTVSVTCSPAKGINATLELTSRIRSLGHRAIPHVAARMVEGPEHTAQLAAWFRQEGVEEAFIVGGDAEQAGSYADGEWFLADLLDAQPGLRTIGVPAYPDGHAIIDSGALHLALHRKQALLTEAGVAGFASTQMCFDDTTIARWLTAERQAGLTLPIHLGLPGVVDRAKLLSMGMRLGIGSSLRYLRKNRSAIGSLFTTASYDPNQLLVPLSSSLEPLGVTGIHCFTFNQVETTTDWQRRTLETS